VGERVTSWFAIVLLTAVLATSYWYAQYLRAGLGGETARAGAVDFFAEGIALTAFDPLGRPRFRLFADRLTHFGSSDDVDLVRPRVLSMRADQPQVQATAREAHGQNNGQSLQMRGDVVVTRAGDAARPPMELRTDELRAVPDDDHFWTDAPVRVQSGNNVLRSQGMDFDNVARRIELRREVVGVFPPRSKTCVRCP